MRSLADRWIADLSFARGRAPALMRTIVRNVAGMEATVTDHQLDALGDILLRQGHCDQQTLDRARRVAAESDQRLDAVLIQLGLVSERGLADAYADCWRRRSPRPTATRSRSRCCRTG